MTGSLSTLTVACLVFLASHLALAHPPVRSKIAERVGEWGFLGFYSLISIASLAWMIGSYIAAPEFEVWEPVTGFKRASLTLMLFSSLLRGYTTPNPGAFGMERLGMASGPRGVLKITRYPVI